MAQQTLLSVENLTVQFRGDAGWVNAVEGRDFAVRAGECLGIAGESGSVKSVIAVAWRRKLLSADEPPTALDVTIQSQILELLRELQREIGMSVILITHDLGVVAEFAQRVVVMYAGRVVESAAVPTLFERPVHPYTEGLIRAMPDPDADVRRLATIPGNIPDPSTSIPGCRFNPRCSEAIKS